MRRKQVENIIEAIIHILVWLYVFASPLLFMWQHERIDWNHFGMMSLFNLFIAAVFYVNYCFLIPRFVLRVRKVRCYILSNLLLLLVIQTGYELQHINHIKNSKREEQPPLAVSAVPLRDHAPAIVSPLSLRPSDRGVPPLLFVLRNSIMLVFAVGAAVLVRLSKQWRQSEEARQQAELGRSQAELQNIKNQINPHFLLNTLNNIYALTAFDTDKAQQAIQELSRMLHYVLYENQSDRVSLKREVEFIRCYIELMRLRMAQQVEVRVDIDVPQNEEVPVAPLIFISLVENAFKHGVSPTQPSFIHIDLKATARHLRFSCDNTNFPQPHSEGTPGGIGFKQVVSRLEMSYPGRYTWEHGPSADGTVYHAEINVWDRVRA
ncbi:MAG: sensor histidine kinase [Alloprevotella sp.]